MAMSKRDRCDVSAIEVERHISDRKAGLAAGLCEDSLSLAH